MAAPPISERHLPHFHRRAPVKEAVRAATTANITISTALNNGDSLDGLTLATGDRVLVKDQSTGSQNGIYVVGVTPVRDYDESTDDPSFGYLVYVREGTANGGTLWKNTNTSAPTIGSTSLTFSQFTSGVPSGPITTSGLTQATAKLLGRTTASTGAIEEISVGTGLSLSAGTLSSTTTNVGGATVQYPALKPGSPTYDFDGASLPGAFSAHSSRGSFGTGDCMTQGVDWVGSSVELQYSLQMGMIYVTHSNGDLDFQVGGIGFNGAGTSVMFGIAALDSAGTGIGVTVYGDGFAYIAAITTWNYASQSDSWASAGHNVTENKLWWLRLKRVSGTWTGYVSLSGRAWDKTFATRADSVTVDRLAFGLLYNTANDYAARLTADYMDVTV